MTKIDIAALLRQMKESKANGENPEDIIDSAVNSLLGSIMENISDEDLKAAQEDKRKALKKSFEELLDKRNINTGFFVGTFEEDDKQGQAAFIFIPAIMHTAKDEMELTGAVVAQMMEDNHFARIMLASVAVYGEYKLGDDFGILAKIVKEETGFDMNEVNDPAYN